MAHTVVAERQNADLFDINKEPARQALAEVPARPVDRVDENNANPAFVWGYMASFLQYVTPQPSVEAETSPKEQSRPAETGGDMSRNEAMFSVQTNLARFAQGVYARVCDNRAFNAVQLNAVKAITGVKGTLVTVSDNVAQ